MALLPDEDYRRYDEKEPKEIPSLPKTPTQEEGAGGPMVEKTGGSPCAWGGTLGQQVKGRDKQWHLITPCPQGTLPKKAEDGRIWCCPYGDPGRTGRGCKSDADCPEGQKCVEGNCIQAGEEGCAGGYPLRSRGQSRCPKTMVQRKYGDEIWCCPEETPPGPAESPCGTTGGYQLTEEVGFPGGVGAGKAPWEEVPGTERSAEWEAHYVWNPTKGKYVTVMDPEDEGFDLVCRKGYTRTTDRNGNVWCCASPGDGGGIPGDGVGGEFAWSEDLQGLIGRIMERANYLLDYPRGLTPEERQGVINYAVEGIRAGEPGRIRSKQEELSRMGLLGSGFELTETDKIRRETRGLETQVRRELAIDELNRRFSELMGTTGMVGDLGGFLMQTEQVPEVLSAARRQEGYATTNALLNYLSSMMGGQGQSFGPYYQAILSQLGGGNVRGGSGSSPWDWLPWLLLGL